MNTAFALDGSCQRVIGFGEENQEDNAYMLTAPWSKTAITADAVQASQAIALPDPDLRLVLLSANGIQAKHFTVWLECIRTAIDADNDLPALFWWQQDVSHEHKGSLEAFQAFCHPALMLVLMQEGIIERIPKIVGVGWLTQLIPGQQAHMGVWYAKSVRKTPVPVAVTKSIFDWCFSALHLQRLWGETISPAAVHLLRECDGQVHATIPRYIWYNEAYCDLTIVQVSAPQGVNGHVPGR